MKIIIVILISGMFLAFGCLESPEPAACTAEAKLCPDGSYVGRVLPDCEFAPCPATKFCDATTPCPEGYECYKFEDEDNPICYIGADPCEKCPAGECTIAESYPMQVFCTGELFGEPPCDENNQCEVGECYKYDDRDYPICWQGDPCSRCTLGECTLVGSDPPVVECIGGKFCGWSTTGACSDNSDCMTGGCSGQVCQSKNEEPVTTTCEWRECYDAVQYAMTCGCVDGKCEWYSGDRAEEPVSSPEVQVEPQEHELGLQYCDESQCPSGYSCKLLQKEERPVCVPNEGIFSNCDMCSSGKCYIYSYMPLSLKCIAVDS